jgi:DNA invertase Pin-like site-specific DNA recombinase
MQISDTQCEHDLRLCPRLDRRPRLHLGVAAKLERRRIAERTARGRADAKAKGVKFGRKPKLTAHQRREARERIEAGETQRNVARSYNVSQATISRVSCVTAYNE